MILDNKIVVVTGGEGLLGREIVADVRRRGGCSISADVTFSTDLSNNLIYMDVTDDNSIELGIKELLRRYGRIDGWVNNAYPRTSDWGLKFEDIPPDSWRANVEMQLNSYFVCSQKVLKVMTELGKGAVVNIASIYGIVGNDFSLYQEYGGTSPAAYSAIKGGVINFTRYLASYYGPKGIRVNCVSPGGIVNSQHESFIKRYEAKVPLRRMARPEDISPAVSFLLSDDSSYVTGHNFVVDGGWTII